MPLSVKVGIGPDDIVLNGDPAPHQGGTAPNFRSMPSGQTAGWIKMPLGTEVGLGREVDLGPSHIVLDGDSTAQPLSNFRSMYGQTVAHLSYC